MHAYESCLLEYNVVYFSALEAHTVRSKQKTTVNQVTHLLKSSKSLCLRVDN